MLELEHTQLDVEHVLLALLSEPDSLAVRILQRLRVNPDLVRSRVSHLLEGEPKTGGGSGAMVTGQIYLTPQSKALFEAGSEEATRMHDDYIGTEHLFLALVGISGSEAAKILKELGVTGEKVREAIVIQEHTQATEATEAVEETPAAPDAAADAGALRSPDDAGTASLRTVQGELERREA